MDIKLQVPSGLKIRGPLNRARTNWCKTKKIIQQFGLKDAFGVQTKFAWITDLQSWGWWAFYCLRQLIVFVRGRSFYLFSKSKPYLSVEKVNLWNQLGLYRSHSGGCAWASSTIVRPVRNQKYTWEIHLRNILKKYTWEIQERSVYEQVSALSARCRTTNGFVTTKPALRESLPSSSSPSFELRKWRDRLFGFHSTLLSARAEPMSFWQAERDHRSPRSDFLAAAATLLHPRGPRGQSVKPSPAQFHFPIFATKTESRHTYSAAENICSWNSARSSWSCWLIRGLLVADKWIRF